MAKFIELTSIGIRNLPFSSGIDSLETKITLNVEHIVLVRPANINKSQTIIFVDSVCCNTTDDFGDPVEVSKPVVSRIEVSESYDQVKAML